MVDKDLVDYIKKQLAAGHSEEEIREHLIGYGYQVREVDDAIELARGPELLPVPPAAPVQQQAQKGVPKPSLKVKHKRKEVRGNLFLEIFKEWFVCLFRPDKILTSKKEYLEFSDGFMHILLSGVLAGIFSSVYVFVTLLITKTSLSGISFISVTTLLSAFVTLIAIFKFPAIFLSLWLVLSAVFYLFAILLGGKGYFKDHSVLTSTVLAPLLFLGGILGIVLPINYAIVIYFILIGLAVYPLTISVKISHEFETWKAALSWIIPLLIVLILLIPAYKGIFSAIKAMF